MFSSKNGRKFTIVNSKKLKVNDNYHKTPPETLPCRDTGMTKINPKRIIKKRKVFGGSKTLRKSHKLDATVNKTQIVIVFENEKRFNTVELISGDLTTKCWILTGVEN